MATAVIDVRCIDADLATAADLGPVDAEERARAARFHHARDAHRFLARRAATRRLLAPHLRCAPGDVRIARGPFGRPYVRGSPLRFSVSHAGPLILIAIADDLPLGCDIEQTVPHCDLLAIAGSAFTPAEAARIGAVGGHERARRFYECWLRKEAYLKAIGTGMSLPMNSFEFVRDAAGTERLDDGGADWSSISWSPAPGYRAAIVAAGDRWTLGDRRRDIPDER